jgi:hypothetical protein
LIRRLVRHQLPARSLVLIAQSSRISRNVYHALRTILFDI